jgi:heat shock protein HslJ
VRPIKNVGGTTEFGNDSASASILVADWKVAPTITAIDQTGAGEVTITWKPKAAADQYRVYEEVDGKLVSKATVTTTTAKLTNVSNTTHKYCVRPIKKINGKNEFGNDSAVKSIVLADWKVGPEITEISQTGAGEVTITWQPKAAADKYRVYEEVDGTLVSKATVTTPTAKLTNVAGGTHVYSVKPIKNSEFGNSSASEEIFVGFFEDTYAEGDFTYSVASEGKVRVDKYNGTATEVTVPEKILEDRYTVTEIGDEAFMNNASIVSVDLPDTITRIGKRAFKNCTKLANMN